MYSVLLFPISALYGILALILQALLAFLIPSIDPNDGIHLAVSPKCGPLSGTASDFNAGLNLAEFKTIVSFGDSFTDGGRHDGGPLEPAVLIPPNALAGGRSTNGPVWVEGIASDIGATVMDYAWSSAVTNISLWPSNPYPRDFIMQTTTFINQNDNLDPETTLYTVFFGINDWEDSFADGNHLPAAAQTILSQMTLLASPPTNARNFLVTDLYGRGSHNAWGEAWVQSIFNGLLAFRQDPALGLNVAFANFATIWDGVLGSDPGYEAFGYTNTGACLIDGRTCEDPEHYFYWFYGHPSKQTHRIMADYVEEVLMQCRV
ncbi:carbohydrate esterase family 16 protein [Suillus paluster]|uniref:carbohydrate esterase family 16 protein n=1 Tax=Suillus paluster TaxID=48578 RepID=UPI001B86DD4E|nr:carbohydrate esterase family 16 protein [Suillus paluster]KAG1730530.1 carbohydrate esterase family 16 protein [Suillus paluster]